MNKNQLSRWLLQCNRTIKSGSLKQTFMVTSTPGHIRSLKHSLFPLFLVLLFAEPRLILQGLELYKILIELY